MSAFADVISCRMREERYDQSNAQEGQCGYMDDVAYAGARML